METVLWLLVKCTATSEIMEACPGPARLAAQASGVGLAALAEEHFNREDVDDMQNLPIPPYPLKLETWQVRILPKIQIH